MRKEYEMTQAQLDKILEACKPVPYMVFGGAEPLSPQANANAAWQALGEEMCFDHMTVRPNGKGDRFFTADSRERTLPDEERVYKDPWSEGLYNCTTGANYLRGGEYHRLIDHLESQATKIEHLTRCLKEADERYRRRHSDLMYADILCTLAGDLTSGREGDNV